MLHLEDGKKTWGKTSEQEDLNGQFQSDCLPKVIADCCWISFKYSLPKLSNFHSRLVLWRCYIVAQGIILAVLFSISIIYFNYQVLEQENLIQFSFWEAICNVDEVDEYKMQRRLQHIKKSDLMVQREGFLRIILHSCCSALSLAPLFWAVFYRITESQNKLSW